MSFWVAGSMAVVSAYGASETTKANNRSASRSQANTTRRYLIKAGIAQDQMEEQQQFAVEKMTDVTRQFLVAKGRATAIQAEAGVDGVSSQRQQSVMRTKASEEKGKIAREIDTNVVNIAQDIMADRIDSMAQIDEAESRKKNVFTETAMGAMSGAIQGYSLGSKMGGIKSASGTGAKTASNGFAGATPTPDFDGLGYDFAT